MGDICTQNHPHFVLKKNTRACCQAGESNLRTLDKRETANTNTAQQGMVDMELRMRDMAAEMTRFKRNIEAETRTIVEGMKAELRQREAVIQQLDGATRGLALQVRVVAGRI